MINRINTSSRRSIEEPVSCISILLSRLIVLISSCDVQVLSLLSSTSGHHWVSEVVSDLALLCQKVLITKAKEVFDSPFNVIESLELVANAINKSIVVSFTQAVRQPKSENIDRLQA